MYEILEFFSDKEQKVIQELSIKQELTTLQVLKQALRAYQLIIEGDAELKIKKDLKPFGEYRG